MALDQGRNLAVLAAEQQVAFPVPGYGQVFRAGWTLADRDGVGDSAVIVRLLGVMARTAYRPSAPQMLQQFLLQSTTGIKNARKLPEELYKSFTWDRGKAKLNAVARRLNERPRKTLNFKTSAERFHQTVASIGRTKTGRKFDDSWRRVSVG